MLKICFSVPKLLYFLRTSTCFNHPALLEKYDITVRDALSKACNVNFDDISSTQLACEMGGLGVSFASFLALPVLLASAFGASDFLTTIFLEFDESTGSSPRWKPENWTQPVYVKTAQELISRMDDKRSKVSLNSAQQGRAF